jgi:cytochrome c oxidase subunit 4
MERHITPFRTYLLVYLSLILLLAATVGIAFLDLGFLNLIITLAIASVKALLVILYFMHVRESEPATKLFVIAGFIWLIILMGLTLTDYLTRGS